MSAPPLGRLTVQNSHADLGAFRHDTLLFFEKALVHMGNLANGLVRIGFPLANMVVMALSVNFGSGCTANSQVCLEPDRRRDGTGPLVPRVPFGSLPIYHTMTNTFVTHIENDFSLLVNLLRTAGTLSRQAVVCLSMDLKLSSCRHINISLFLKAKLGVNLNLVKTIIMVTMIVIWILLMVEVLAVQVMEMMIEGAVLNHTAHIRRPCNLEPVVWQPVRRGDGHEFWMNGGLRLRPGRRSS